MRHTLRAGVIRAGVLAGSAGLILSTAGGAASGSEAAAGGDWPAYLNGPAHSSYSKGQTTIRPADVGRLVVKWRFRGDRPTKPGQPRTGYLASPTVVDGDIYIGANTGWFYKLNAATGHALAKRSSAFSAPRPAFPRAGSSTPRQSPRTGQGSGWSTSAEPTAICTRCAPLICR